MYVLFAVGHLSNVFFTIITGTAVYWLISNNVSYLIFKKYIFIQFLHGYFIIHYMRFSWLFFPQFMWFASVEAQQTEHVVLQPSTATGQMMCSDKHSFVALRLGHPLSLGVTFSGFSWHFLYWLGTAALQWRLLEEGETRYKHKGRSQDLMIYNET